MQLPTQPDLTPTTLHNPDLEPFVFKYMQEDGQKTYVIPPLGIETFPKYLADKMARKLADKIIFKRGIKHGYERDHKAMLNIIYERNNA